MTAGDDGQPFDAGLQTERTLLAWRRTCLSLAVGNTVAVKYLSDALGPWATLVGVAGLVLAAIAWLMSTLRYRRVHAGLVREQELTSGGRMPTMVAAAVVLAGVAAIVLLFTLWRPW